jgi:phenylpyruvate tautomerase PptA (4-oxalocrotonate tautomerase family)
MPRPIKWKRLWAPSQREAKLIKEISETLSEFLETCKNAEGDFVLLYQGA